MPVYLARFGALGPVKIGSSLNVRRRLDGIQSRLWDQLSLIRLLDGTADDERTLHRRFDHLRIKHEWFTYSPEMMGDLGLPDLKTDPTRAIMRLGARYHDPDRVARSSALRGWMIRSGLFEEDLAKLLDCTAASIEGWLYYGWPPPSKIRRRLIELSEGELAPEFTNRVLDLASEAAA